MPSVITQREGRERERRKMEGGKEERMVKRKRRGK